MNDKRRAHINTTKNRVSRMRMVADVSTCILCALVTVRRNVFESQAEKYDSSPGTADAKSLTFRHKRKMRDPMPTDGTGLKSKCCCETGRCEQTDVPWCFVCMLVFLGFPGDGTVHVPCREVNSFLSLCLSFSSCGYLLHRFANKGSQHAAEICLACPVRNFNFRCFLRHSEVCHTHRL